MKSIYPQIANTIRESIRAGLLLPGQRLPSQRQLAVTHNIAQNTAREVYRALALEGLVTTRPGSGVYVCGRRGTQDHSKPPSYSDGFRDGVAHERARIATEGQSPEETA